MPREDRGFMTSPALKEFVKGLRRHPRIRGRCRQCGASWEELRESATEGLRVAAEGFTRSLGFEGGSGDGREVLMTGHQPEFFHPGVWIKNFVTHVLAEELGLIGINVIVDNDSAKRVAVRVPVFSGERASVITATLCSAEGGLAYEEVEGEGLRAAEFAEELREAVKGGALEGPTAETTQLLREEAGDAEGLVEYVTRVRGTLERRLGFGNLELPVSLLSEGVSFRRFASHIISSPWEFAECYNSALRRYRRENNVRSSRRPLPDLESSSERVEVPFWVWRKHSQRERLFVRRVGGCIGLSDPVGKQEEAGWEEGQCSEAAQALEGLDDRGWKLRPRALSMTAFLRSFASAGFIHGIGGGKYDEVTDSFLQDFFGLGPAPYCVVSATLLLPIARRGVLPAAVREQERVLRDFRYNPQRHGDEKGKEECFRRLAEEKFAWIENDPRPGDEARRRFEKIRELNGRMLEKIQADFRREKDRLGRMREDMKFDKIASDREYGFILHPMDEVKEFFSEVLSRMREGATGR